MKLSIEILRSILVEKAINPFSLDFSAADLAKELKKFKEVDTPSKSLIKFIHTCNDVFRYCNTKITDSFETISLSKQEITKLLFRFCNSEYFKAVSIITNKIISTNDSSIENQRFLQIENETGYKMNAGSIPEMQVDITAELLGFLSKWQPTHSAIDYIDRYEEASIICLQNAWRAANIILILRDQCFELILHDYCYPEWTDDQIVKIKREIPVIEFIRTASDIRVSNHIVETTIGLRNRLNPISSDLSLKVTHLEGYLKMECEHKETSNKDKFRGLPNAIKYHTPYLNIPLKNFNGLTVVDLLKLFGALVESLHDFAPTKIIDDGIDYLFKVPFILERAELSKALKKVSGYTTETIEKFLGSLICNKSTPYFWNAPLYEQDHEFFILIHSLTVPNFSLYIDKWLSIENLTLNVLIKRFKDFLVLDLQNEQPLYPIQVLSDFSSNENNDLSSNILLLTRDKALVLELVFFQYPISYKEHEDVVEYLGLIAVKCHEKAKIFANKYKSQIGNREVIIAIVSEYPTYSGLIINAIPIIDTTLLYSYLFTGEYSKTALHTTEAGFRARKVAALKYFFDEDGFNNELKSFLTSPLPVHTIIRNLRSKALDVFPPSSSLRVIIEVTEHVGSAGVMIEQTAEVEDLLKYEYYVGPGKELAKKIEESIFYNLSILIENLAHSSYVPQQERIDLVQATMAAKSIGQAHLIHYLMNASSNLIVENKITKSSFTLVPWDENVIALLEKLRNYIIHGVALSEFEMPNIFSDKESKLLISTAIRTFDAYAHKFLDDEDISTLMLNLLILQGFRKKYGLQKFFFTACLNLVDLLNQSNHFQKARDFCEEILHLCIRTRDHKYAWLLCFNCYSHQNSFNEAALYGCLFFSCIKGSLKISNEVFVSGIFALMKFLRNFGFSKEVIKVYNTASKAQMRQFDRLKLSAVYFYTLYKSQNRYPQELSELPGFLDKNFDVMKKFGTQGVTPWIGLLYNLQRLEKIGIFKSQFSIQDYIDKLSLHAEPERLEQLEKRVLGINKDIKQDLIELLMTVHETRDISDYVNEITHLDVPAYNLIRTSIEKNDSEGIFLTSLILSDQTLTYRNFNAPLTREPLVKLRNEELFKKLSNYQTYILGLMNIKPGQLLVWIFEFDREVGCISIDDQKNINIAKLGFWVRPKLHKWTSNISGFHFNAKNRSEIDYDLSAQERDYRELLDEFKTGDLNITQPTEEILICLNVELSAMPHNLIVNQGDFISEKTPVTNVISLQYFAENNKDIYLPESYRISAWIPIEDGNMTINWGYNSLEDTLLKYKASIYTQSEPGIKFNTDINIFMAHGVREFSGFKAVRTTDDPHSTIIQPSNVFGTGCIAVLFICNSGSTKDDFYSKQIISFSTELLRMGYKAVISSFWPYDVTMANRWLATFLNSIDEFMSVSEAVYNANSKLANYDSSSSTIFYAPAGRLSMHLYGNPNIRIGTEKLD